MVDQEDLKPGRPAADIAKLIEVLRPGLHLDLEGKIYSYLPTASINPQAVGGKELASPFNRSSLGSPTKVDSLSHWSRSLPGHGPLQQEGSQTGAPPIVSTPHLEVSSPDVTLSNGVIKLPPGCSLLLCSQGQELRSMRIERYLPSVQPPGFTAASRTGLESGEASPAGTSPNGANVTSGMRQVHLAEASPKSLTFGQRLLGRSVSASANASPRMVPAASARAPAVPPDDPASGHGSQASDSPCLEWLAAPAVPLVHIINTEPMALPADDGSTVTRTSCTMQQVQLVDQVLGAYAPMLCISHGAAATLERCELLCPGGQPALVDGAGSSLTAHDTLFGMARPNASKTHGMEDTAALSSGVAVESASSLVSGVTSAGISGGGILSASFSSILNALDASGAQGHAQARPLNSNRAPGNAAPGTGTGASASAHTAPGTLCDGGARDGAASAGTAVHVSSSSASASRPQMMAGAAAGVVSRPRGACLVVRGGGHAVLTRCQLCRSMASHGAEVTGAGSSLVADGCLLARNESANLFVSKGAVASLRGSMLSQSRSSHGACVREASAVNLLDCKLCENAGAGLWVADGSVVEMVGCVADGNETKPGLEAIGHGTKVTGRRCQFNYNRDSYGVYAGNAASVVLEACTLGGNELRSAKAHDPGTLIVLSRCTCDPPPKGTRGGTIEKQGR